MKKKYLSTALFLFLVAQGAVAQSGSTTKAGAMPSHSARHATLLAKRAARQANRTVGEVKQVSSATAPSVKFSQPSATIYGSMIDSYDFGGIGIYSFSNQSDDTDFTFVAGGINASNGGVYVEGMYYTISGLDNGAPVLNAYDATNGFAKVGSSISLTMGASDLTYDPTTNKIYGCFTADYTVWYWGTLNPATGEITTIGAPITKLFSVACQKDGDIYAIDGDRQLLYVNKATGVATNVGAVEPYLQDYSDGLFGYQSATFDWNTDVLYWHPFTNAWGSGLIAIQLQGEGADATVAANECVKNYTYGSDDPNETGTNEQMTGLFMMQSGVSASAPDVVTDLTTSFDGAALTGKASFCMPAKAADGTDLTSTTLTYTLTLNGETTATGEAKGGAAVEVPLTVPAEGLYTIAVSVALGTDASKAVEVQCFIGQDAPMAPASASMTLEGNQTTVTWDAVSEGAHGGYVGDVTYTIVRQPGDVVVATGLTATTWGETLTTDIKQNYWYEVHAVNAAGTQGEAAKTYKFVWGSVNPVPYANTFDTATDANGFTVVDVNNDGATWAYNPAGNSETQAQQNMCYTPSSANDANDWLMTPAIHLDADSLYTVQFTVQSNFDQTLQLMLGNEAKVESMTTPVTEPFTHQGTYYNATRYEARVKATSTGAFHFGFHVTSAKDGTDLYLDNLRIERVAGNLPVQPTAMTVEAGAKGALEAHISLQAPTQSISGAALTEPMNINIYRDDRLLYTAENVQPGAEVTYDDMSVNTGMHTYAAKAEAGGVMGDAAVQQKYIGLDVPGSVRNLKVVEDWQNNPGTIIATWDAPSEVGQHGGYVDPEGLIYYSYNAGESTYLGANRTCSATVNIAKGQTVDGFCIYADNNAGTGKDARITASCMVGAAKTMPLYESFPGVTVKSGPWSYTLIKGDTFEAYWDVNDGTTMASGTQDGDGGVSYFETAKVGNAARYRSPKVDVRGAENPAFVFYLYHTGKTDSLNVEVSAEYGDYVPVKHIVMNDQPVGWHRYEIPLKQWANSAFLQIGLAGYSVESTEKIMSVDNMSFRDAAPADLEAISLQAPTEVRVGKEGTFTFQFANRGEAALKGSDYKVELYKNDVLCGTFDGIDLDADRKATLTLTDVPTIDDPAMVTYVAKVNYAADMHATNDATNACQVRIAQPLYPVVTDLAAADAGEQGIALSWNEPDVATMPAEPDTDDFESYTNFITEGVGAWTLIDADGAPVKQISVDGQTALPYPTGNPMAYIVYNPEAAGLYFSTWKPYSGQKMLVAFSASKTGTQTVAPTSSDWLISPELNGFEQTIAFFAKVGQSGAVESFDLAYSTTEPTPEAMTTLRSYAITNVSAWQEIREQLPVGAKYFAVHYKSADQMALLLDNFTFTPAGKLPEDINLLGYNVYRDGQKLNDELLGDAVYADADVKLGESYTYKVTAVYDKGESVYSDAVTIVHTGVNEATAQAVSVSTAAGTISVNGATGMSIDVYNAAGVNCYHVAAAAGSQQVSVMPGVYVVKVGSKLVKVSVK